MGLQIQTFELWTLIFLLIAAQGFFLSFLLASNKRMDRPGAYFLSLFILIFSIILSFWVGFWNDFHTRYSTFELVFFPLPFLLGPSLFYFVKSHFSSFRLIDLGHLFPFVITSLLISIMLVFGEIELIKDLAIIIYSLHTASFIFYSLYILWRRKKSVLIASLDKWDQDQINIILIFFQGFTLLATANFVVNRVVNASLFLDLGLGLGACLFIYLIGYLVLNTPFSKELVKRIPISKYANSALKPEHTQDLIKRIKDYLNRERPYLKSNFKLEDLSAQTNIPSHHISELLNQYQNQSFSELINIYRVEEAKKLLLDPNYQHLTVSSIGYEVGFNSRTTFYYWFQKLQEVSPSKYQKTEQKRLE